MEGLGFILFLVAILASVFDQGRKPKGEGPPPSPPRRRPRVQFPQPGQPPRPRPPQRAPAQPRREAPATTGEGSAAELLPEDFWAELTGRAPARRPPEELPPTDLPSWDEEAVARVEGESRERQAQGPRALDAYRRPEVVREAPRIVSLETPLESPEKRHAAFHRRLDAARERAAAIAPPPPAEHPLRARLRSRAALRDSFVLQEVFGRPKGLEE